MSQDSINRNRPQATLSALRRFVRPRTAAEAEQCDLCSADLASSHPHLVNPSSRQLLCACQACAILFNNQAGTKYKRVPRRVQFLPDFQISDAQWESLLIPIGLAFFLNSSSAGKVLAIYPSPAGPTESLLDLESWEDIARDNPILNEMESDVEALLVSRVRGGGEYYLVPIDECYTLVGLIRTNWRGLSGGTEVWQKISRFFTGLKERAGSKEPRA